MKKQILIMLCALSFLALGCGEISPVLSSPQSTKFEADINDFCDALLLIDGDINEIDPQSEDAEITLLEQLELLNMRFQNFAELDFPEEYDYLETYTREASDYMKEAVLTYKEVYTTETYESYKEEYARENYKRAFKRVHVILAVLRGEDPNEI